jgi:hypothetical protein
MMGKPVRMQAVVISAASFCLKQHHAAIGAQ